MTESNLQRFEFPEHDIDIEAELQSIPLRLYKHKGTVSIGVCLLEASVIGEATVKLLFIDSASRDYTHKATRAINKLGKKFGFSRGTRQRRKCGQYITQSRSSR